MQLVTLRIGRYKGIGRSYNIVYVVHFMTSGNYAKGFMYGVMTVCALSLHPNSSIRPARPPSIYYFHKPPLANVNNYDINYTFF